ncbi:MAG: four helix bundle protein [Candidatus Liptonbacteria bacterium]|nr:four helix bundle protein [Candidatus Liptonbacteria bacterium]
MRDKYGFYFRDWDVYKDSLEFRKKILKLLKKYPKEELFALSDQTKRALNSIVLAIAEGANKITKKDTRVYINRAHCSLDEVIACLDCALSDGYISSEEHEVALREGESLAKRLHAFVMHLTRLSS